MLFIFLLKLDILSTYLVQEIKQGRLDLFMTVAQTGTGFYSTVC